MAYFENHMTDSSVPLLIDALGQACPAPLLMLKRALKQAQHQHFLLKSSDAHSRQDISRYCQIHHLNCEMQEIQNEFHFFIRTPSSI